MIRGRKKQHPNPMERRRLKQRRLSSRRIESLDPLSGAIIFPHSTSRVPVYYMRPRSFFYSTQRSKERIPPVKVGFITIRKGASRCRCIYWCINYKAILIIHRRYINGRDLFFSLLYTRLLLPFFFCNLYRIRFQENGKLEN